MMKIIKKKSGNSKRRKARALAVQALYQYHFNQSNFETLKNEFTEIALEKKADQPYFEDILEGTLEHLEEIDKILEPLLDRKLKELDITELSILRYAIFELTYRPDVPPKVTINEALEITKTFGSVAGFKYVNGILDKALKNVR